MSDLAPESEITTDNARPYSVSEIIAIICADLGITPDWQAWSLEPWAIEERGTQVPGSPYNTHPTSIEHTPNIHSDDLREAPA